MTKCSVCREEGHNITECKSPILLNIYTEFENTINNLFLYNLDFIFNKIIDKMILLQCICDKCLNKSIISSNIKFTISNLLFKNYLINLRILSFMNNMSTSKQKLFLVEQLVEKYMIKIEDNLCNIIIMLNNINTLETFKNSFDSFILNNYTQIQISICIAYFTKYKIDTPDNIIDYFFDIYSKYKNEKLYLAIQESLKYLLSKGYTYQKENINFKKELIKNTIDQFPELNEIYKTDILKNSLNCPICFELLSNNTIKTECNHYYCNDCFTTIIDYSKPYHLPQCSICRSFIKKIEHKI